MFRTAQRPSISLEATFGGYPCRIRELGTGSAAIEQSLHLPAGHRAHLSFRAAGEWFHIPADVDRSGLDRERSADAGHLVYRTELQLCNVEPDVAEHLRQLLQVLELDRAEPLHTEALQFEIVGY
ncbi:MAG TPA: hypothetical protein VGF40_18270 [Thermoanaerobaculia bacterium]